MICIYHSRDIDGWMSAAIVKLKYPEVELIGWDYGSIIPDVAFQEVIMVDVSLSPMLMKEIRNRTTWIDHHKSAIQDSINNNYQGIVGIRDSAFAACELTWKYFFPEHEMPEIVRLLGRYDCFGHKGTEEELKVLEFQYGARASLFDPETCLQVLKDWDDNLEHSIQVTGYNIYNYLCNEAQQIYARAFPVVFQLKVPNHHVGVAIYPVKILCVNQERFNPINFGLNYHKNGYDGFLCYHYANKKWNFSLYNDNGEIDCSEICKMLGGGGHKGAAGFVTDSMEFIVALTQKRLIELNSVK